MKDSNGNLVIPTKVAALIGLGILAIVGASQVPGLLPTSRASGSTADYVPKAEYEQFRQEVRDDIRYIRDRVDRIAERVGVTPR